MLERYFLVFLENILFSNQSSKSNISSSNYQIIKKKKIKLLTQK